MYRVTITGIQDRYVAEEVAKTLKNSGIPDSMKVFVVEEDVEAIEKFIANLPEDKKQELLNQVKTVDIETTIRD